MRAALTERVSVLTLRLMSCFSSVVAGLFWRHSQSSRIFTITVGLDEGLDVIQSKPYCRKVCRFTRRPFCCFCCLVSPLEEGQPAGRTRRCGITSLAFFSCPSAVWVPCCLVVRSVQLEASVDSAKALRVELDKKASVLQQSCLVAGVGVAVCRVIFAGCNRHHDRQPTAQVGSCSLLRYSPTPRVLPTLVMSAVYTSSICVRPVTPQVGDQIALQGAPRHARSSIMALVLLPPAVSRREITSFFSPF